MSITNGLGKEMVAAGQLIIKANVGDDIRRIPIHNDDLTYDELILMMQRVFKGVLKTDEELVLKYKDEDGDLVSLTDTNDLSYAIQYSRVLRLTILTQEGGNVGQGVNKEVIKELRLIRDRVNHLLDTIVLDKDIKTNNQDDANMDDNAVDEVTKGVNSFLNLEKSKEFDPLGQDKVESTETAVDNSDKTRQMSGQSSVSNNSGHGQQQQQTSYQQQQQQQHGYPGYNNTVNATPQQTPASNYPQFPGSNPSFPASPRPAYQPQPAVSASEAAASFPSHPAAAPPTSAPSYAGAAPTSTPSFPGATPTTTPSYPGASAASTASYPGTSAAGTPSYPPGPGAAPTASGSTAPAGTGYPQQQQSTATGYPGPNQYQQQQAGSTASYPGYPGHAGQQQSSYPGQTPGAGGVYPPGNYGPGPNPYSRAGPPQGGAYPRPPQ